jgi:hypothetical protein
MDKSKIVEAIQRIALANGGKAPGRQAFESQTGIKMSDWYPHHWLRWGEALIEAGYKAKQLQTATSDDALIQSYVALVRELQHLPVDGEIRRKAKADKSFPSHGVFARFGGKGKLLDTILHYCQEHPGYEDVIALLENRKRSSNDETDTDLRRASKLVTGFVYLMKSGRHYKIGRTVSVGSRERQLAVKIPVPPTTVNSIETDDPCGVEAYWHKRFAEKRGEGEWFDLSADDIKAFKRRIENPKIQTALFQRK